MVTIWKVVKYDEHDRDCLHRCDVGFHRCVQRLHRSGRGGHWGAGGIGLGCEVPAPQEKDRLIRLLHDGLGSGVPARPGPFCRLIITRKLLRINIQPERESYVSCMFADVLDRCVHRLR